MGKALVAASTSSASTTGTNFAMPGVNSSGLSNATEANRQVPFRAAGILSLLQILCDAVGTTRSVTLRKAGADQSLIVTMTDTTAGLYTDAVHSVAVAAGDLMNMKTVFTGATFVKSIVMNFMANGAHAWFFTIASALTFNTATTVFLGPNGTAAAVVPATEAFAQHKNRAGACGIIATHMYASANTWSGTTTFRIRVNGVNGNNLITLGASTTGLIEDTAHTDSLVDGDLYCWTITTAAGAGLLTLNSLGMTIVTTAGQVSNDVASRNSAGTARAAGAGQTFYWIAGGTSVAAAEADAKIQHGFAARLSRLRCVVTANTYTGAATLVTRINGANGNQSVSITAATTGYFEDTTNTDTVGPTDDVNLAVSGGTANSMTVQCFQMTETDLGFYKLAVPFVSINVDRPRGVSIPVQTSILTAAAPPVTPNLGWLVNLSAERNRATVDLMRNWVPVYLPDNFYPRTLVVSLQTAIPLSAILATSSIEHVPTPFFPRGQVTSIQTAALQTTWNVNLKIIQDAPTLPPVFNAIGWLVNLSTKVPIVSYNTANLPSMTPFTAPILIGRIANQVSNVLGSRFSTMQGTKFPEQEPGAVLIGNGSWYPWIRRRRRS